ncbi:MAG: response regulator transcription factor [Prochloraceae cyanobacterium]|nr:response regulator transcription factor [Prochloraceae cyanobacterium]
MSNINTRSNNPILLINTDPSFTQQASIALKESGYNSVFVKDPVKGWSQFAEFSPAMVLVDNTSASKDNSRAEFCRQIRDSGSRIPILMLLSQATVEERVTCLESGADDYLLKPYQREAFLQALRLYLEPIATKKEELRFGELALDLVTRRVTRQDRSIDLTMKEFELLKYLMSHPQEVVTREQILENVWGYDFRGESNVIEVYIRYLRLKIESEGQKRLIQTVRGIGYVLRES